MRRLLRPALLGLLLAGCMASPGGPGVGPVCTGSEQCPAGQVCFPDGCGDPGSNLAVEVTPNAKAGQHAQDFSVPELTGEVLNFELFPRAFVAGDVTQAASSDGTVLPYSQAITVRAVGESLIIPGLFRHFQALVTSGDGRYALPIATGRYAVLLTPADPLLPPLVQRGGEGRGLEVVPGSQTEVDFTLPSHDALVPVSGHLVKVQDVPLATDMEVQALAAGSLEPLSQPALVPRDTSSFQLMLPPEAFTAQAYLIRASPRAPAPVPSKLFTVASDAPTPLTLEMGAFGAPVRVTGTVLDRRSRPLAGAAVHVRGEVVGGGTYRSESVKTDLRGAFTLTTLASAAAGVTELWVVPPTTSASGPLRLPVTIPATDIALGTLVVPDKVQVRGVVREALGSPASGMGVAAVPLEGLPGLPRPASGAAAVSDEEGQFELVLEPGSYRLDFSAPGQPRYSQRIAVLVPPQEAPAPIQTLDPTVLPRGLTVRGTVRVMSRSGAVEGVAAFATVRFYRVVPQQENQPPSHLLLAEAVTDSTGSYTVLLPTR